MTIIRYDVVMKKASPGPNNLCRKLSFGAQSVGVKTLILSVISQQDVNRKHVAMSYSRAC